jgi:hypothetical protein
MARNPVTVKQAVGEPHLLDTTGASELFLGAQSADALYLGADLVWKHTAKRTFKCEKVTKDPSGDWGTDKPATTEPDGSVWVTLEDPAGDASGGVTVRFFIAYQGAWWPISKQDRPGFKNQATFLGTTDGIWCAAFNWPGATHTQNAQDKDIAFVQQGQYLALDLDPVGGCTDGGIVWDVGWPPGYTNKDLIQMTVFDPDSTTPAGQGDGSFPITRNEG